MLQLLQQSIQHQDTIWSVDWHPQGNFFITCSSDRKLRIYILKDRSYQYLKQIDTPHIKSVRYVKFHPINNFLACSSFDSTISIFSFDENMEFDILHQLEGQEKEIKGLDWSYDGKYLISSSRDQTIWVWELEEDGDYSCAASLLEHSQDVKFVKFRPQTYTFFSASFDNTIKVWVKEDDDWVNVKTLKSHESTVWSLDIKNDIMCSGDDDGNIRVWDLSCVYDEIMDGEEVELRMVQLIKQHDRAVYSCGFNSSGQFMVSVGSDNKMCVYKKQKENEFCNYSLIEAYEQAHSQDINQAVFHPELDLILTVGDDQMVKLWELS